MRRQRAAQRIASALRGAGEMLGYSLTTQGGRLYQEARPLARQKAASAWARGQAWGQAWARGQACCSESGPAGVVTGSARAVYDADSSRPRLPTTCRDCSDLAAARLVIEAAGD